MGDLPSAIADADEGLDNLLSQLEKGAVPDPEVPATAPEAPVAPEPVVETPKDNVPEPVTPDLEKQLEKSNQRYKTLEGMMKADRKRSTELIQGLEQQLADRKAAEVEAPLDVSTLLSEEEQAEFGESGIAVLEKLAGAIAEKAISKAQLEVEQKLSDMEDRVDQAEASSEGNTTWDLVEKLNPGSKAINKSDPGWFAFLAEVDPVSGSLYRDIGEAAASVNDARRLAELIDTYRESANLAKPAVPVKPSQTPVAPKDDGSNQPPSEKRVYSQDEIREFYDNRTRGLRKGITANLSVEQMNALELDIDVAMEEGRVKL